VENHENYHAERSQSRDFKQVPAKHTARNMKNRNKKMGGSVGEQKETQGAEVRFLSVTNARSVITETLEYVHICNINL
jgi:hypothetical protein